MNMKELLAKSDGTTLRQHTNSVVQAAKKLSQVLTAAPDASRSAFYHDFGKAAQYFQEKMYGGRPPEWYRHELFSFVIAVSLEGDSVLPEPELAAILTHHKNLNRIERDGTPGLLAWSDNNASQALRELVRNQLNPAWSILQMVFGKLPILKPRKATELIAKLENVIIQTTVWDDTGFRMAMNRAALVASDHLASSQLSAPLEGVNITRESLQKYAKKYIKGWSDWSYIQQEAEERGSNGSALLIAPTGAGKTEAAVLWALRNRKGGERIFYVLPYQVSINSMAERISKIFPAENGSLKLYENNNVSVLHSNTTLAYFQDALNDDVDLQKAILIAGANKNAARKIYSPIKVTTVYQLLNIFFGRKFFEVGLLELANSIIIFDEIHAYDGHTLGLILVMLKYLNKLNARIFIMTATLPRELKEQLREAACIPLTQEITLKQTEPLRTEERRKLKAVESLIEDNIDHIKQTIKFSQAKEKKVVIVCNTVSKAVKIWDALKDYKPLLVHSRFTLGDRIERERKENIEEFSVVVSTQVIEVSLDVSFGVMFTELAPADCLLQRFGRVNRHGTVDPNNLGQCYVYTAEDPGSKRIYDPEILELTKNHLPEVPLCFVSACDWMEKVYPNGLSESANKKKENAQSIFESLVAQLKPMIDPPVDINLEESLMSTVEVIPLQFEKEWIQSKTRGEHLLARLLVVNVSYPSWCGALRNYKNQFDKDGFRLDRTTDKYRSHIIARFHYDHDTGLRLDKPIPPSEDGSNFM